MKSVEQVKLDQSLRVMHLEALRARAALIEQSLQLILQEQKLAECEKQLVDSDSELSHPEFYEPCCVHFQPWSEEKGRMYTISTTTRFVSEVCDILEAKFAKICYWHMTKDNHTC